MIALHSSLFFIWEIKVTLWIQFVWNVLNNFLKFWNFYSNSMFTRKPINELSDSNKWYRTGRHLGEVKKKFYISPKHFILQNVSIVRSIKNEKEHKNKNNLSDLTDVETFLLNKHFRHTIIFSNICRRLANVTVFNTLDDRKKFEKKLFTYLTSK